MRSNFYTKIGCRWGNFMVKFGCQSIGFPFTYGDPQSTWSQAVGFIFICLIMAYLATLLGTRGGSSFSLSRPCSPSTSRPPPPPLLFRNFSLISTKTIMTREAREEELGEECGAVRCSEVILPVKCGLFFMYSCCIFRRLK